jgi:anti-sigma regulatory factor (Ser/Thr protein kinase)
MGSFVDESRRSRVQGGIEGGHPRADIAFTQTYAAVPESVAAVRAAISGFATRAGVPRSTVDGTVLAVSEAATNVVVHAYHGADEPGLIHVEAGLAADELRVSVADTGRGLRASESRPGLGLGLGLAMITELADRVELLQGKTGGLRVVMHFTVAASASGD